MPDVVDLKDRVTFQRRAAGGNDGYGNSVGAWADLFSRDASLKPTRGNEQIQAARLQGLASFDLWVLYDSAVVALNTDDRVVDFRDANRTFNIRFGPVDMTGDKEWLFLQVEQGGADG